MIITILTLMSKLTWKKCSSMSDTCEIGDYLLKRKLIKGGMAYEVWRAGKLIYKTRVYDEFMNQVIPLIRNAR